MQLLDRIFFYAPTVSLGPLISYRRVLQGDPVKIRAIWGRQNLLLILLTTLISALTSFREKIVFDTVHTQVKA